MGRHLLGEVALQGLISMALCSPTLFAGRSWNPSDHYENTTLFGGSRDPREPVPLKNYEQHDIVEVNYPEHLIVWRAMDAGELPLWDPYRFFGQPIYNLPAQLTTYPPRLLLNLLFGADASYSVFQWLHLWLAGVAMVGLARRLDLSPAAARFAGIAWMLCGPLACIFKVPSVAHLAWLPVPFACGVRMTWRSAMAGAVALTALMQVGGPSQMVITSALLATFALSRWRGNGWKWTAMIGASLLMTSPVTVPVAERTLASTRAGSGVLDLSFNPASLSLLATTVFPRILGSPFDRADLHSRLGLGGYFDYQVYLGLAVLVGVILYPWVRRRSPTNFFFWAALIVLGLLLVRPLNALLHAWIPSDVSHILGRISYVYAFGGVVSASIVFDRLLADPAAFRPVARRLWIALAIGVSLTLIGSAAMRFSESSPGRWLSLRAANGHVWGPLIPMTLLAACLYGYARGKVGLFAAGWTVVTAAELGLFFVANNATHPYPLAPPWPEPLAELLRRPSERVASDVRMVAYWGRPYPNLPVAYGIRSAGGWCEFPPVRYCRWTAAIGRPAYPRDLSDVPEALAATGTRFSLREDQLAEIPEALPRVFLVREVAAVSDERAALDRLVAGGRPPAVEGGVSRPAVDGWEPAARIERDGFNEVTIRVETTEDCTLVLLDSWSSEWTCTVDGRPTKVLKANYLFRAVDVPAGSSAVAFRFVPKRFYLLCGLAALTLVGVAAAWWKAGARRGGPSAN